MKKLLLIIFLCLSLNANINQAVLGIHFDNVELAQNIGTLALIFILFGFLKQER